MSRDCELGFADLFRMAHGRAWTEQEELIFRALGQRDRNEAVRDWARQAGGIVTEDRVGTDGVTYTAFWTDPKASAEGEDLP